MREMEFTPGWSIGWYFIPIAALWKPYQAMKEIWITSHATDESNNNISTSILPLWWFFWLLNGLLGQAVFRMSSNANNLNELININHVYRASDIASVLLAFFTLSLVNKIYYVQQRVSRVRPYN